MAQILNHTHLPIELLFILCLTALASVTGQIVTPNNTAVDIGNAKTVLNCSNPSALSNQFVWSFKNFSTNETNNVATGCSPFNTALYDVDKPTANTCNLIILYAREEHAGLYTCSPGGQTASSAQFIVLGPGQKNTSATCVNTFKDQNSYTFDCGARYLGYMIPSVTWYNGTEDGGIIIPTQTEFKANAVGANFTGSITPNSSVPINQCKISFKSPTNPPTGQATNTPTYTSYCNVTQFNRPIEVTITVKPKGENSATKRDYSSILWMLLICVTLVLQMLPIV